MPALKTPQQHAADISALQDFVRKAAAAGHPVALGRTSGAANTTRSGAYRTACIRPHTIRMNALILVDKERRLAWVEPHVTMEELCAEAFKSGLVPPVVPEFKGITVGGAIMGAALESSSHLQGQFSDQCDAYELLLADGSYLRATKESHSELFYGISGSYGSLALLVGAWIRLVPAKPFVELSYEFVEGSARAFDRMRAAHEAAIDFLDCLALSPNSFLIMRGMKTESQRIPLTRLDRAWSPWFYQSAMRMNRPATERYLLKDYLFRYDRGAFWMGAYLNHPLLALYYLALLGRVRRLPAATTRCARWCGATPWPACMRISPGHATSCLAS